ncbi:hypothetical protein ACGFXC_35760 [Streptomyces sp. NPDC048507]|uniref:hypothetical protein n=1 Tax=Streptomyces sp. NPDC048507 TaxID=3365560 RepID=UPI00371202ED
MIVDDADIIRPLPGHDSQIVAIADVVATVRIGLQKANVELFTVTAVGVAPSMVLDVPGSAGRVRIQDDVLHEIAGQFRSGLLNHDDISRYRIVPDRVEPLARPRPSYPPEGCT